MRLTYDRPPADSPLIASMLIFAAPRIAASFPSSPGRSGTSMSSWIIGSPAGAGMALLGYKACARSANTIPCLSIRPCGVQSALAGQASIRAAFDPAHGGWVRGRSENNPGIDGSVTVALLQGED